MPKIKEGIYSDKDYYILNFQHYFNYGYSNKYYENQIE